MKVALFDYDGTLMDTESLIFASYEELFRRYRSVDQFTYDKRLSVLGPPLKDKMIEFFPELDPDRLIEEYRDFQSEHVDRLLKPIDNAFVLTDYLKSKGIKVGLVSTRLAEVMEYHMEKLNRVGYFDVIVGYEMVEKSKPDPEGIFLALDTLGIKASREDCMYVGDNVSDVQAGKNANIVTVGFVGNLGKEKAMIESKPDYLVYELMEIQSIVDML